MENRRSGQGTIVAHMHRAICYSVVVVCADVCLFVCLSVLCQLCTFLFSILVLFTTTRLIRQSVAVLMEGVPEGIEPDDVEEALRNVPGVIGQCTRRQQP